MEKTIAIYTIRLLGSEYDKKTYDSNNFTNFWENLRGREDYLSQFHRIPFEIQYKCRQNV